MKLQILVPQYRETDEEIRPLLDSIKMQRNVDFNEVGVIICNDGSDVYLTKELMDSYPFHIEYWKGEHEGVSATRNALLDHASADYIMFCDADDLFYNVCGLYIIFGYIEGGFDTLNSAFIEETRDRQTKKPVYVTHNNDATFVHGKVHRRQFLIDNAIRWNDKLTIHEDSFFHVQCLNLAKNLKYCETPYYLWRWRDGSVCRSDPKYIFRTYDKLIDSNDAVTDEFVKRGYMDKVMYFVCYMILESYYTMNKPDWVSEENAEYRKRAEERIGEYYVKWENVWNSVPIKDKVDISKQTRDRLIGEGMLLESLTIYDWLTKIKEDFYGKQKNEREEETRESTTDAGLA